MFCPKVIIGIISNKNFLHEEWIGAVECIVYISILERLVIYGITDGELGWFCDYLFSRKAAVAFNNCLSNEQVLLTGVPQGSIFGSLLFVINFNEVMEYSSILQYADNTVLYVAGKEIDVNH